MGPHPSVLLEHLSCGCALGLAAVGLVLPRRVTPAPFLSFLDAAGACSLGVGALFAAIAGLPLVWGWAAGALGFLCARALGRAGRPESWEARLGAAVVVAAGAWERAVRSGEVSAPALAGWALAGWVTGGSFGTMLLGHWYLNVPGLSFDPLRRAARALAAGIGVRAAWVAAWGISDPSSVLPVGDAVLSWARIGLGVAVPGVLILLVLGCVKVRANQSATGILYALTAVDWIGEAVAAHLFLAGAVRVL